MMLGTDSSTCLDLMLLLFLPADAFLIPANFAAQYILSSPKWTSVILTMPWGHFDLNRRFRLLVQQNSLLCRACKAEDMTARLLLLPGECRFFSPGG